MLLIVGGEGTLRSERYSSQQSGAACSQEQAVGVLTVAGSGILEVRPLGVLITSENVGNRKKARGS